MSWRCHLCGDGAVDEIPAYALLPRVTSDCRPWPAGGRLGVCGACGTVQKALTPRWREECAEIYASYALYPQAGGAEQRVFEPLGGTSRSRSRVVLERLARQRPLPAAGRLLDFGSGNGALLKAAAELLPQWRLVGVEQHPGLRAEVERGVPGARCVATVEAAEGRFDLIALMHSLEHIEGPAALLRALAARLTGAGCLLVEVPSYRNNPFDLLIADHCSHFAPATLAAAVRQAGLAVVASSEEWVPKELSLLAAPAAAAGGEPLPAEPAGGAAALVAAEVAWLHALLAWAEAGAGGTLGVFGTAIAGSWLAGHLGPAVRFFVDEDPARVGRDYLGRPVLAPRQVPPGATVLVALPPAAAAAVAARLGGGGVEYRVPPVAGGAVNGGGAECNC